MYKNTFTRSTSTAEMNSDPLRVSYIECRCGMLYCNFLVFEFTPRKPTTNRYPLPLGFGIIKNGELYSLINFWTHQFYNISAMKRSSLGGRCFGVR